LAGQFEEADLIGSPYAITEYCCNAIEIGSNADLQAFRRRLRQASGALLMLDFVPNHTARDSPWCREIANIYLRGGDGEPLYGRDPYSGDWTDTAQLNYWSLECRAHMKRQLLEVAALCDGVRCDMAMLNCNDVVARTWGERLGIAGITRPATEFWSEALAEVYRKYPNFVTMAECYEYTEIYTSTADFLHKQGFQYTYDKVLYDRLCEPSPRSAHLDNLRAHIFGASEQQQRGWVRFTENHDEPRTVVQFTGFDVGSCAAVLSLTLPGMRFVYWGQERGHRHRLAVHLRRALSESPVPAYVEFYRALLAALASDVFRMGAWAPVGICGNDSWRLLAWSWSLERRHCLAVVNFSDTEAWASVDTQSMCLLLQSCTDETLPFVEVLSGESYERDVSVVRAEGLLVGLKPFTSQIFSFVA